MAEATLTRRVDALEDLVRELAYQSIQTQKDVGRLAREMRDFKDEMRGFKGEMLGFKDEMRAFKDEMLAFKDEMLAFKDEMHEFKDEMRAFKQEMIVFKNESERDRREMNRQWGDLANRMGTLLEDIVAPNLPRIARDLLGCPEPEFFAVRVVRRVGGDTCEYDALLVCPERVVINETKSKLKGAHVERMIEMLADFARFYPEYADRRPLGTLATLYPDAAVIRLATRRGILMLGMGDTTIDVLNPEVLAADA